MFYILMQILNAVSSESTQSVGHLEYIGKFDFIFETNSGYESGDQMLFLQKIWDKNLMQVYL
jgi:hypothetical protein